VVWSGCLYADEAFCCFQDESSAPYYIASPSSIISVRIFWAIWNVPVSLLSWVRFLIMILKCIMQPFVLLAH